MKTTTMVTTDLDTFEEITHADLEAHLAEPDEKHSDEKYLIGYLEGDEIMRTCLTLRLPYLNHFGWDAIKGALASSEFTIYTETGGVAVLVLPLNRPIDAAEYELLYRFVARLINLDFIDDVDAGAGRWLDLPISEGHEHFKNVGPKLQVSDPDSMLNTLSAKDSLDGELISLEGVRRLNKAASDLHGNREGNQSKEAALFNGLFGIADVIEIFLSRVFEPTGDGVNFSFTGGSLHNAETVHGSAGSHLFGRDPSNPWKHTLINAFDLLRLHTVGDGENSHADLLERLQAREGIIEKRCKGWITSPEELEKIQTKACMLLEKFEIQLKEI